MSHLRDTVSDLLAEYGAVVDKDQPDLLEAILPDDLARRLGTASHAIFAFHPEAAREQKCPLLTPVHPFVQGLTQQKLSGGLVRFTRLPAGNLSPAGLEDRLRRSLHFSGTRWPQIRGSSPREFLYLRFAFLATYVWAARTQELIDVLIDLSSGWPEEGLITRLDGAHALSAPAPTLPLARPVTLDQAFSAALAQAANVARSRAEDLARTMNARAAREMELVNSYYDALTRELQDKLDRTEPESEPALRLVGKLQATAREKEYRLELLKARYSVRVALDLDSLHLYSLPKLEIQLTAQRRQEHILFALTWNPLTSAIDMPHCVRCGNQSATVCPTPDGLLCPRCASR
ncbi:MAG TPA: hypothetical protein GX513_11375 [Firmicutes bacterium]|nr:hypothetical protein [Bacillota bacterium]